MIAPEAQAEALAAPQDRGALARRVALWLVPFAVLGAALVFVFPDSYQQDGGHHFLTARWALIHRWNLVGVWGRPLFTAIYAFPAQLGYPAAKLFTVAVCLAAGWQAARLAQEHGLKRPELAVPLLFLQPSFLLLCPETMTEPLFALVLAIALRLHRAGRIRTGLWVASLLPLARPEGFFIGILWGAFVLFDRRAGKWFVSRAAWSLLLLTGTAIWWLAALAITHDPRYIIHNWPSNWAVDAVAETGPLWHYWTIRNDVLGGPVMVALFAVGTVALLATRRATLAVASALLVTGLHAVFFRFGYFGSLGYARYLVCVSVPIALMTLEGWNVVAGWLDRVRIPRRAAAALGAIALVWALGQSIFYVDAFGTSRDAWAVRETWDWFLAHPRPVNRLIFSQAYMSILSGRDPYERPGNDRAWNEEVFAKQPAGTLVFWDAKTGPQFHPGTGPEVFERAGYERLFAKKFPLPPHLPFYPPWVRDYEQELYLYYKP
jgi:hypothetical protein